MNYTRISADCHIDMPAIPPDPSPANPPPATPPPIPHPTPRGARRGLRARRAGGLRAALAERPRVAEMGRRGPRGAGSGEMEPRGDPVWEPLWAAVNEVGLPVHCHTSPTLPPSVREKAVGKT